MMLQRAVVIFPPFDSDQMGLIEQVRWAYDPLAALVPPHITLVFPFTSELSAAAMETHVAQVVGGCGPFAVRLQGVTGHMGEYLFLNVEHGNDQLIALHDRLYTGPLAAHLAPAFTYIPHLTVGRLASSDALRAALGEIAAARRLTNPFVAEAREVSVYSILPGGGGGIESRVPLRARVP
jgi:2'-5' RNA ligase